MKNPTVVLLINILSFLLVAVVALTDVHPAIVSLCDNEDVLQPFCLSRGGECVKSAFGIKCGECNFYGYLEYDLSFALRCVCYSTRLNPFTGCEQTSLDQEPLFTTIQVEGVIKKKVTCVSFQSEQYGCFKPVDSSLHRYGDPDPPIPNQCCHENIGPPPGELVDVLSVDPIRVSVTQETCNQYGGIDPDTSLLELNQTTGLDEEGDVQALSIRGFRACHNHGSWDPLNRTCNCYKGWKLAVVGEYPPGTALESCVQCDTFRGPDVLDTEAEPPYCSKIYTPNGKTGKMLECGGGGSFIEGKCECFANSTAGYWALLNLTYLGTTEETCGICVSDCP